MRSLVIFMAVAAAAAQCTCRVNGRCVSDEECKHAGAVIGAVLGSIAGVTIITLLIIYVVIAKILRKRCCVCNVKSKGQPPRTVWCISPDGCCKTRANDNDPCLQDHVDARYPNSSYAHNSSSTATPLPAPTQTHTFSSQPPRQFVDAMAAKRAQEYHSQQYPPAMPSMGAYQGYPANGYQSYQQAQLPPPSMPAYPMMGTSAYSYQQAPLPVPPSTHDTMAPGGAQAMDPALPPFQQNAPVYNHHPPVVRQSSADDPRPML